MIEGRGVFLCVVVGGSLFEREIFQKSWLKIIQKTWLGGAPVAHLFLGGALRAEIIQKFSLKINQKFLFILRLVMTSFY